MNKTTYILIFVIAVLAVVAAFSLKGRGVLSKIKSLANYSPTSTTNPTDNTLPTYSSPVASPTGSLDQQLKDLDSAATTTQNQDTTTDPTTGL